MVAKCANPECHRKFRQLSKGRLFLLPPSPDPAELISKTNNLTEYCYWLCPECSRKYTIARVGSAVAITQTGAERLRFESHVLFEADCLKKKMEHFLRRKLSPEEVEFLALANKRLLQEGLPRHEPPNANEAEIA